MNAEKTGKLIRELRKEKGWTQKEFASALHITDKAVSKWETGKSMPDFSLMPDICAKLGVSLPELLSGERGKADMEVKDSVSLIMDLVDREKAQKVKVLNGFFLAGCFFLLSVLLCEYFQITGLWKEPFLDPRELLILTLFGVAFELLGFYHNSKDSRRKTFTEEEIEVLTKDEREVRMRTADEMLQFARKYQKAELRQYKLAFEEIEKHLEPDEYAVFSLVGDDYTVNESPGPWHIAIAVTDSRILLGGETVRGRLFTRYVLSVYERSEILSMKVYSRKLILRTPDTVVKIRGENLESVMDRMKEAGVKVS